MKLIPMSMYSISKFIGINVKRDDRVTECVVSFHRTSGGNEEWERPRNDLGTIRHNQEIMS